MANQSEHWTPPSTFTRIACPAINMLGAEFNGYEVTRRTESSGSQACWELTCKTCLRTRIATGTSVRRALRGDPVLAACRCDETEDDTSLIQERLEVSPAYARVLIAVVSHQRAYDAGVTRRALKAFLGREPHCMALARRGLIAYEGSPVLITATPKTWKAMRPEEETRT